MSTYEPNVFTIIAGVESSDLQILTQGKTLLRFWPDGTSKFDSEEDLREAASVFWQRAQPNQHGSVQIPVLSTDPNKPAGFCINRNRTLEYFGGYAPDESTRRTLETIASLKP